MTTSLLAESWSKIKSETSEYEQSVCQSDTSVLTLLGSPRDLPSVTQISWLPPEPEIARLTLAPAVKTKKSKKTRCMMGTLMEHLGHVEGEEMPPNQETRTTKRGQQKISKHAHPDPCLLTNHAHGQEASFCWITPQLCKLRI